jgi:hypothetical protein
MPATHSPRSERRRAIGGIAALCLSVVLAGCGGHDRGLDPPMPTLPAPPARPPQIDPAALASPRWSAVLAAGDVTLHVDDDAVAELDQRLETAGIAFDRIHLLSADKAVFGAGFQQGQGRRGRAGDDDERPRVGVDEDAAPPGRRLPGGIEPARPAVLLRQILALDGSHGGACLVYLASTGDAATLKLFGDDLTPDQLDRALGAGCGTAPTVVVVSGCATGAFAQAPMTRPNRLILTATTGDRRGFGCGPNEALTTFDECFLGALDGAPTWLDAFDRTRRCVARRETLVGQPAAEPQVFAGDAVRHLAAPWSASPAGRPVAFRQGIGKFTLDGAPYFPTLKARTRPEFEAYARAPLPKALALTLSGTVAWAASSRGETPDDVDRIALQRCEWQSSGACILFARNDNLAAAGVSGQPALHPSLLVRSGAVDPATVPFIRSDQRRNVTAYLALPGPKALALGPDNEALGIGRGATRDAARAAALANCRAADPSCVVYAEDQKVVLDAP